MAKSNDATFILDIENVESYLQLLNEQWVRFNEAQDAVETSCGAENFDVEQNARVRLSPGTLQLYPYSTAY